MKRVGTQVKDDGTINAQPFPTGSWSTGTGQLLVSLEGIYICIYIDIYIYVCIYIRICMDEHFLMYMYICIQVYIHIYI